MLGTHSVLPYVISLIITESLCANSKEICAWGEVEAKVLRSTFEVLSNVCCSAPHGRGTAFEACLPCLCRLFGGLVLDVKRKAPWYCSDYRDALSLQCLASFLFLYCACMSPVITFGGLLGEATEGRIVRPLQNF